jgi:hypothetical protein
LSSDNNFIKNLYLNGLKDEEKEKNKKKMMGMNTSIR